MLRGLHYQAHPKPQTKLIRCVSGEVFDVAVNIRKSSPTFGEWASIILNDKNKLMVWIPEGFAHGFLSLKDNSEVIYKSSSLWSKKHERSIKWNDKRLDIKCPLEEINCSEPEISNKDAEGKLLEDADIFD